MMVEVRQNGGEGEVADGHDSFVRLADVSAKFFAEQAAAMAMMTAFGMSVAGQMTGMMLGALRTTEASSSDSSPAVESEAAIVDAVAAENKIVHLRPKPERPVRAAKTEMKVEDTKALPKVKATEIDPEAEAAEPSPKSPRGKAVPEAGAQQAQAGDDLKRISGIGPRLEKVLNGRGIHSYLEIAGLGSEALKRIDDELGLEGRVMRDDWAGQARALAAGRA